jgi:hypothetical protein
MKPILISAFLNDQHDKNILTEIFGTQIPPTHTWTEKEKIIEIIEILSGSIEPHCIFPPDGGLIYLEDVELTENGCFDFLSFAWRYRFEVKSLTFIFIGNVDNSYFLLETIESIPTGIYKYNPRDPFSETVAEVEPGNYVHRDIYDNFDFYTDYYSERPLLIKRYLKGSVLILNNNNPYRQSPFCSDGLHSRISLEELTDIMEGFNRPLKKTIL